MKNISKNTNKNKKIKKIKDPLEYNDFIYNCSFVILLAPFLYTLAPDVQGFDANDIIIKPILLITIICLYHFKRMKIVKKKYFKYLNELKKKGKISKEKWQKAKKTKIFDSGISSGIYISENGEEYIGEFKDGQFNGNGIFIFSNGNKYSGKFKNNKPHGEGTLIYMNGNIEKGFWRNGIKLNNYVK